MQIQQNPTGPKLDLSRDSWSDVFHLRPDDLTTNDDVVHSDEFRGGFRVSTAAAQPGADGGTSPTSATVHMNYDRDRITMSSDGWFAVVDGGKEDPELSQIGPDEGATLSGDEVINVNRDGSLGISAGNLRGLATLTLLKGTGTSVDVTIEAGKLYDDVIVPETER